MVDLIKAKFVAVALNGRIVNKFKDSETEFLLQHNVRLARSASGTVDTITASGKPLEHPELHPGPGVFKRSLERALKAWEALPASERTPGAVEVPERGPIDPRREVATAPPAGALIVRVHNRQLMTDGRGGFRYTVPEDYVQALRDPKLGFVSSPTGAPDYYRQATNDMLWITREEGQALMPANPVQGQGVPFPPLLRERILRYQLEPARGLGEGENFIGQSSKREGDFKLTVEAVSQGEVRLRLDGWAALSDPRDYLAGYQSPGNLGAGRSQFNVGSPFGHGVSYKPRLLGYLAYDPAKKVLTRFDLVALGLLRGRPCGENISGERLGPENPLGIAFELVTHPKPADYLCPKGLGSGEWYDLNRYLCGAKP